MNIDVIPYASAVRPDLVKNKAVVVIDVLRASSVMITALANGARSFIPVERVEEALKIAGENPGDEILLAGERNTKMIEGFHLGNSPLDYTRERVAGKRIILTTSNGTMALNKTAGARKVYVGAFLNMDAVVSAVSRENDVALICSGTNNTFSMDDGMCAASIIEKLQQRQKTALSDFALTLLKARKTESDLRMLLKDCYHLNLLIKNGFEPDVEYCLKENLFHIVPRLKAGEITI